jgi:hypothetical protein
LTETPPAPIASDECALGRIANVSLANRSTTSSGPLHVQLTRTTNRPGCSVTNHGPRAEHRAPCIQPKPDSLRAGVTEPKPSTPLFDDSRHSNPQRGPCETLRTGTSAGRVTVHRPTNRSTRASPSVHDTQSKPRVSLPVSRQRATCCGDRRGDTLHQAGETSDADSSRGRSRLDIGTRRTLTLARTGPKHRFAPSTEGRSLPSCERTSVLQRTNAPHNTELSLSLATRGANPRSEATSSGETATRGDASVIA